MSTFPSTTTTDLIQEYLDENKRLILAIYQSMMTSKKEEYDRDLARLRQNLEFLARIADNQPQQASTAPQHIPNPVFHQQLSMAAARSSTMSAMHHQQPAVAPSVLRPNNLQGESGSATSNAMPTAGGEKGKEKEQAESSRGPSSTRPTTEAFPDLLLSIGTRNQDAGSMPSEEVPGTTNVRREGGNRRKGLRITVKPPKFEIGKKPSS